MQRLFALTVLLAATAAATPAAAGPELVGLDAGQPVRIGDVPGSPRILAFWGQHCPPCLGETKALPGLAAANPDVAVVAVATGDMAAARRWLRRNEADRIPPNMRHTRLVGHAEPVLKAVGSRNGGLPYTIAYSSRGTLCATYSGALGADALAAIRGACRTRGD